MWISSPITGSHVTGASPERSRSRSPAPAHGRYGRAGSRRTAGRSAGSRPGGGRKVRTGSKAPAGRPGWADEDVELFERGGVLLRDHGAHPLCLAVVGVVVAGRECVGAEHDPPLRLVSQTGVARLLVHLADVRAIDP